uniref:Paired domain-containing protein n=1 Tax=Amphimedon queenslandica TaxID=400682 RepID=A0A1X7TP35_AMPQE
MPVPLSNDLRWRIVYLSHHNGYSDKKIANTLYISRSTVKRIIKLYHQTGDVSPCTHQSGPPRMLREAEIEFIVSVMLINPSIYLDELKRKLCAATGCDASIATICRTLNRIGFTRKKIQYIALQQDEQERMKFMEEMSLISPEMIVWIDETGSDRRKERRNFGYHLRGITPVEHSIFVGGHRLNAIVAMSFSQIKRL